MFVGGRATGDQDFSSSSSSSSSLFLVGHDVGYYGPPFFPVGSNFCASVYVHSCISGDVSQPSFSKYTNSNLLKLGMIVHKWCVHIDLATERFW